MTQSSMSQFSLFGAAAARPTLEDVDAIRLAGGHWVRRGAVARLSIVVEEEWRADALTEELALRGLGACDAKVDAVDGYGVRTAFNADLAARAARWTRGANEGPPPDFVLTPGGLRLWAIASGRREPAGYLMGTARPDDAVHLLCGAQLSRLGLGAVAIASRAGCGWRITSARRIRRLGELLGPAPIGAGEDWPSVRLTH